MSKGVYRQLHSPVQDLLNQSFDPGTGLVMAEIAGKDDLGNVYTLPIGPKGLEISTRASSSRYDIQGNIIYTGEATVGSVEGDNVWTVTKYDLSDLTNASGKVALLGSWTGRAGLTYA